LFKTMYGAGGTTDFYNITVEAGESRRDIFEIP
jgi:hypothetical protein